VIAEIIDETGDGAESPLEFPADVTADGSGNVYLAGYDGDNTFGISPQGYPSAAFLDVTSGVLD